MKIRREELRSIAKSRERVKKVRRKRRSISFFLSPFPYIYRHIYRKANTRREARRVVLEKGKGDSESGTRPMARWPPDTHFTARLNESENRSTDLRSSDLRHTYLKNCISIKYVSSSLNEDRKNIDIYTYRNIRLLRDENYIRSWSIYLLDGVYEPTVQIVSIN